MPPDEMNEGRRSPQMAGPTAGYTPVIPITWRALAVLGYAGWLFGGAVILPFMIWTLFRNRFVRRHALLAGVIQGTGLLISGILYALHYLFIIELDRQFISLAEFWGVLFAHGDSWFWIVFLLLTSIFLLVTALEAGGRRRGVHRPAEAGPTMLKNLGWLAIFLVIVIFYNNLLSPSAGSTTLQIPDFNLFRDPFELVPGHLILLFCVRGALTAAWGKIHLPISLRSLYLRFLRDEHKRGPQLRRAALLRSYLFPGWGLFFGAQRSAGIATALVFMTILLFFTISLLLNYGRVVAELPNLNSNAAWYFLGELGLRSHIPDKQFKAILGDPRTLFGLGTALLLCFVYSRHATGLLFRKQGERRFRFAIPHSLLLHLTAPAILLLIPVSFQIGSARPTPHDPEPFEIIPEFFEIPSRRMPLDGATYSGDGSKTYGRPGANGKKNNRAAGRQENAVDYPGPGRREPGRGRTDRRLLLDERRGKDPLGGRPGRRQDMTYSNYLSARIRGSEKGFNYWNRIPRPYSAIFEYKISSRGQIYDIRILESSKYHDSDRLTVELIRAMGTVLPPPNGGHVLITELFWNTSYADPSLPTDLQRRLSQAFDGRVIQPF